MSSLRLAALVALGAILPGCIAPSTAPPVDDPSPSAVPFAASPFTLSGTECVEAGFVAAYNTFGRRRMLADAWEAADIREEIGNPVRDGVGLPVVGPLTGNWHMGFRCRSVASSGGDAEEYVFGYVGSMVLPPAWDPGGADLHFLMSGFGFANGTIADDLRSKTTASITPALEARIDWYLPRESPRSAAYVVYVDAEKGLYESWSTIAPLRTVPERTIRLWWQVPADGSRDTSAHGHHEGDESEHPIAYHPVSWDLRVSEAAQLTTPPVDGVEWAMHNRLGTEHFPAVAGQPTLTNIYEYPWLELRAGAVVKDVTLRDVWKH